MKIKLFFINFFINLIIIFLVIGNNVNSTNAQTNKDNVEMEKYIKFIKETLKRYNYTNEEINAIVQDPRLKFHSEFFKKLKDEKEKKETIRAKIEKFVKEVIKEESVMEGKNFLIENENLLSTIEENFEVPREILVAILRVETNFGKNKGNYYVFNALSSRAYGQYRKIYKSRTNWKNELEVFIKICKENNIGIFDYKGSRAGCFGIVQFLPSSYVNFAVDQDGNGRIDLFNIEDGLSSAANYLRKNGWQGKNFDKKNKLILYRYNKAWWYVDLLIRYAELIKN